MDGKLMDVVCSINGGTPKWMVYDGKSQISLKWMI
jgi:hypothetical protein